MKISHNITFTDDTNKKKIINELKNNNIKIGEYLLTVKISEDDKNWPVIEKLLNEFPTSLSFSSTKFSLQELQSSNWLEVATQWHHGYPMPDGDSGYRELSYDLKNYCEVCGVGKSQIAPFHMKTEPKWGKKNILQLHWVYDELFVTPEIWEKFFKPIGIESIPVIHYKKDINLKTVVQLKINSLLDSRLLIDDFKYETCQICKQKKYIPFQGRGFYPAMNKIPSKGHVAKSIEYFGSGAEAHREIFFSQELFKKIYKDIKGIDFYPVTIM